MRHTVRSHVSFSAPRRPRAVALALLPSLLAPHASAAPFKTNGPTPPPQQNQSHLRVTLPPSGEVRIENRRGDVRVELWGEEDVSVSAAVAGEPQVIARAGSGRVPRSPVRIENARGALSVGVVRGAPTTAAPRVDLKLRVPARARVQIFTGAGAVESRGLPGALSAQTVSGDIRLDLSPPYDVDLTAHSLNGSVALGLDAGSTPATPRIVREKYQTRLGAGSRAARLFSGRGRISINGLAAPSGETAAGSLDPVTSSGTPRNESRRSVPAEENVRPSGAAPRRSEPPSLAGAGGGNRTTAPRAPAPEAPQEVDEDEVVRVETELVTLNVSVIDRESGRGLAGLTREDFRLYEDNVEQQLAHFESSAAPFDLLLLIDLSGSTARVTDLIRAAALRFVRAARAQDRIGIVTFAGSANVASPLTTNREALRSAVSSMEPPKGDTKLYDAVAFAFDQLEREAQSSRRRAVILMSDGLDSTLPNVTGEGSAISYEELRARAREFDGVLYTIWTSTEYEAFSPEDIQPETFDLVHARMRELADAGGGVFFEVERLEDLAGAYERVIADLGTVYSLSYRPTNKARDGSWRAIRVTLPRRPGAVARGKRGYYAK